MFHPQQVRPVSEPAPIYTPATGACRQEGCPCKDARVLDYRKLRFFKAMAEQRGQTIERVIARSEALPRPNEPQVLQSDNTSGTRCGCGACDGKCDGIRTIAYPVACHACTRGNHA